MTTFGIAITVLAVAVFGDFVLVGAWIDGRRQAVRNKGMHPVTTPGGNVVAKEAQERSNGTGHDTGARNSP